MKQKFHIAFFFSLRTRGMHFLLFIYIFCTASSSFLHDSQIWGRYSLLRLLSLQARRGPSAADSERPFFALLTLLFWTEIGFFYFQVFSLSEMSAFLSSSLHAFFILSLFSDFLGIYSSFRESATFTVILADIASMYFNSFLSQGQILIFSRHWLHFSWVIS